jgi:hypothetical protein
MRGITENNAGFNERQIDDLMIFFSLQLILYDFNSSF